MMNGYFGAVEICVADWIANWGGGLATSGNLESVVLWREVVYVDADFIWSMESVCDDWAELTRLRKFC